MKPLLFRRGLNVPPANAPEGLRRQPYTPLASVSILSTPAQNRLRAPLKPLLSSCVETDRDLVHADQLIAFLAVHDRLHGKVTAKGCAIAKYYPQTEAREKGTPSGPR